MRLIRPVLATAALVGLAAFANADTHGKPMTVPVHPTAPTHSTTTHPTAPSHPTAPAHATTSPHTTTTTTTTTHGHGPVKTTTTTSTRTTTTSSTSPTTTSPIAQKIASKPQLASRIQALLPAGTSLDTAASGFRNQGQFIAAAHVSKNLGIPFDQLKTEMVTDHLSLGQAIQKLRPSANTTTAVSDAETQEQEDLKTTSSSTSTTTTTPTTGTTTTKKHGSR